MTIQGDVGKSSRAEEIKSRVEREREREFRMKCRGVREAMCTSEPLCRLLLK